MISLNPNDWGPTDRGAGLPPPPPEYKKCGHLTTDRCPCGRRTTYSPRRTDQGWGIQSDTELRAGSIVWVATAQGKTWPVKVGAFYDSTKDGMFIYYTHPVKRRYSGAKV